MSLSATKKKNPHAAALGRLARGKPKNFSKAELQRRRLRMKAMRNEVKMQKEEGRNTPTS